MNPTPRTKSAAAKVFEADRPAASKNVPLVHSVHQRDKKEPFMLLSGYEASNNSPIRGYVWFPQMDTRRELSQYSDREIRRRIKWLYANFGIARRIVKGLAKMLGILTPQPVTSNEAWNEMAFENFLARAGSPDIYDRKGRLDFFTAQPAINRHRFKDGRLLGLLTESLTGGARMAFYEAHQINNPTGKGTTRFDQGVALDRFDRHVGYSVSDGADPSKFSVIDARDAIYYANWENFGAIHGLSILAFCVVNMIDVVELRGMRKHAAKNHANLGTVIEKDRAVVSQGLQGLGGGLLTTEVDMPGTGEQQKINWEIMEARGTTPRLAPGERLRVVADDRPTPNNLEFERALIEDCILGVDLPPSALYYVGGLTGPGVRFSMEDIRRWILIEHRRQAYECQKFYAVHIAKEIAAGRLPDPGEPYWRRVQWIGQPDMTIDRGKEGNLSITQLDAGLTTWGDEYAKAGFYGKRKLRERIREVAWAKKEVAAASAEYDVPLSYDEVFRQGAGASAGAAMAAGDFVRRSDPDDDEEDVKPAA